MKILLISIICFFTSVFSEEESSLFLDQYPVLGNSDIAQEGLAATVTLNSTNDEGDSVVIASIQVDSTTDIWSFPGTLTEGDDYEVTVTAVSDQAYNCHVTNGVGIMGTSSPLVEVICEEVGSHDAIELKCAQFTVPNDADEETYIALRDACAADEDCKWHRVGKKCGRWVQESVATSVAVTLALFTIMNVAMLFFFFCKKYPDNTGKVMKQSYKEDVED